MVEENKDRRAIRFTPDKNTLVWVTEDTGTEQNHKIVGLAINESYKGVSAVFLKNFALKVGTKYQLAVGNLAPVDSELRWMKDLDEDTVRVGFQVID